MGGLGSWRPFRRGDGRLAAGESRRRRSASAASLCFRRRRSPSLFLPFQEVTRPAASSKQNRVSTKEIETWQWHPAPGGAKKRPIHDRRCRLAQSRDGSFTTGSAATIRCSRTIRSGWLDAAASHCCRRRPPSDRAAASSTPPASASALGSIQQGRAGQKPRRAQGAPPEARCRGARQECARKRRPPLLPPGRETVAEEAVAGKCCRRDGAEELRLGAAAERLPDPAMRRREREPPRLRTPAARHPRGSCAREAPAKRPAKKVPRLPRSVL